MKKILVLVILVTFLSVGSASALVLFDDEIFSGTYYFNNANREMTIDFNTIYEPWDTDAASGDPNPGGYGTLITWQLTLDFSSWTNPPAGELPGAWEETWGSTGRAGDFEYFEWYPVTGGGAGDYFGTIAEVYAGELPLGPPGPWFILGQFERTSTSSANGYYESWAT